jgi:T5SS/PEP-CTERM-associated repeat protein
MDRDITTAACTPGERPFRRRVFVGALAAAIALGALLPRAQADVVGIGDVTPSIEEDGEKFPDLPIDGGVVTGTITVGGTGEMVGDTDTGQMIISAGTFDPLVSQRGIIGGTAVGSGRVQIFSVGSQWRITDGTEGLIVGQEGQGTLELSNGGQVSDDPPDVESTDLEVIVGQLSGSQGFVTLNNAGTLLRSATLTVGDEGFGQMTLRGSSRVETLTTARIGRTGTMVDIGTGFVTVDGFLTRWTIGSTTTGTQGLLVVGDAGRGALNITNQGEVRVTNPGGDDGDVNIGAAANSLGEVTVDGQFSQLWAFGAITIGSPTEANARGVLRLQNQGLARANEGVVIGPSGVLELAGGLLFTSNRTGDAGTVANSGVIQTAVGSIGQVDSVVSNNSGGEIRTAGTTDRVRERLLFTRPLTNNDNALITSIGGEMEFTTLVTNNAGGTISGRDAIYRFRGSLANNGILGFSVGVSDVYGEIVNNPSGVIGVANKTEVTFYDDVASTGAISVLPGGSAIFLQDLNLSESSVLSLHLNEVASVEQLARLDVLGDTMLGGTLQLFAGSGLDPQPGDSFQIISGTSIMGTFTDVVFPPAPGPNWTISYFPDSVILNYVAAPAFTADFNGDGFVNAADLAIWSTNFGKSPALPAEGDANGDGVVDGHDFTIWQRTIGPVPPPAEGALAAVPEPSSCALLAAALGLGLNARRSRPRGVGSST